MGTDGKGQKSVTQRSGTSFTLRSSGDRSPRIISTSNLGNVLPSANPFFLRQSRSRGSGKNSAAECPVTGHVTWVLIRCLAAFGDIPCRLEPPQQPQFEILYIPLIAIARSRSASQRLFGSRCHREVDVVKCATRESVTTHEILSYL